MGDRVCRGCYSLGTACGECSRCTDELLRIIKDFTVAKDCVIKEGYCVVHKRENVCPHNRAMWILRSLEMQNG